MNKNHVQNLHAREMRKLHSLGVHFLPPGCLNAKFSCSPDCKKRILAKMQKLHKGQNAKNAYWQWGRKFTQA